MSLQDSIAKAAQEKAEADAERVRHTLIDIQTKIFDRAAAYTNLIMLGGYAGGFAIWNFTREILGKQAEVWVALLLTISLATFIFFEVFKMIYLSGTVLKQRAIFTKALSPGQFSAELRELEQSENKRITKWLMPVWIASLVVAVPTAIGAIGICLWNFVTALLSGAAI